MARSPTACRFTVKDYHRMAEAEIFDPHPLIWFSKSQPSFPDALLSQEPLTLVL